MILNFCLIQMDLPWTDRGIFSGTCWRDRNWPSGKESFLQPPGHQTSETVHYVEVSVGKLGEYCPLEATTYFTYCRCPLQRRKGGLAQVTPQSHLSLQALFSAACRLPTGRTECEGLLFGFVKLSYRFISVSISSWHFIGPKPKENIVSASS